MRGNKPPTPLGHCRQAFTVSRALVGRCRRDEYPASRCQRCGLEVLQLNLVSCLTAPTQGINTRFCGCFGFACHKPDRLNFLPLAPLFKCESPFRFSSDHAGCEESDGGRTQTGIEREREDHFVTRAGRGSHLSDSNCFLPTAFYICVAFSAIGDLYVALAAFNRHFVTTAGQPIGKYVESAENVL